MAPLSQLTLAVLLLLTGCAREPRPAAIADLPPGDAGRAEAQADLAQGRLCFKLAGQPVFHNGLLQQILMADYGIEMRIVAGCRVPVELRQNIEGYNAVMTPAIAARFGREFWKDIFPEADDKARRQLEELNAKKF